MNTFTGFLQPRARENLQRKGAFRKGVKQLKLSSTQNLDREVHAVPALSFMAV